MWGFLCQEVNNYWSYWTYWEWILAAPSTLTSTETNTQKNELLLLDPNSEIMSAEGHWTSAPGSGEGWDCPAGWAWKPCSIQGAGGVRGEGKCWISLSQGSWGECLHFGTQVELAEQRRNTKMRKEGQKRPLFLLKVRLWEGKVCIAKRESLGVKHSLNIGLELRRESRLWQTEGQGISSSLQQGQWSAAGGAGTWETPSQARGTGRTPRAQRHQPELLYTDCCEPGHANAPISSESSKSALLVQGTGLWPRAQAWEALRKGSAKPSLTYGAAGKAPRKTRDPYEDL